MSCKCLRFFHRCPAFTNIAYKRVPLSLKFCVPSAFVLIGYAYGFKANSMKRHLQRQLIKLLKELHLPMFREYYAECATKAMRDSLSYPQYLFELAQIECEVRRINKIIRIIKASKLPTEKTLENFDLKRLPLKLRQQVKILLDWCITASSWN